MLLFFLCFVILILTVFASYKNDLESKERLEKIYKEIRKLINVFLKKFVVIFDTNLLSKVQNLFDYVIKKSKNKNGMYYKQIWNKLKKNGVERVFRKVFSTDQFADAIAVVKRIMESLILKVKMTNVIPSFVFNEFVMGFTSKMNQILKNQIPNLRCIAFLYSIPNIRILSIKCPLEEGVDFPPKSTSNHAQNVDKMDKFIELQCQTNKLLEDLVEHMRGYDIHNQKCVKKYTEQLATQGSNVVARYKSFDKIVKNLLSKYKYVYTSAVLKIQTIAGKVMDFKQKEPKIISLANARRNLAERLLKAEEEFDFADLIIYLIARDMKAIVFTFNKQAFQEVNDPIFLGYFHNIQIMHPDINYKTITDLCEPENCETIMQNALGNFDELDDFFRNHDKIHNKYGDEFDSVFIRTAYGKWLEEIKQNQGASKNWASKPSGEPNVFTAIDLLTNVNNNLQIDSSRMFDTNKIDSKIKLLQLINKYFFTNQLQSNHFTHPNPVPSNSKPAMLKNKTISDLVENGSFYNNLNQFLSLFEDRTKYKAASQYFVALHIQSVFA